MTVCYFGIFDPDYPRNRILLDGLKQNGVEIIMCNSRAKGFKKYSELINRHKEIKDQYDVMVVGYMGHLIMPLAKVLSRKPIIFDAFLSLYNTMVYDRQVCSPKSPKAWYYYVLDWLACRLADHVVIDTQAHIDYFVKTFKAKPKRFSRIWIGAHDKFYYSGKKSSGRFKVLWWGWMTPLHGIETMLGAAKKLQDKGVQFVFVGGGKKMKDGKKLQQVQNISNVEWHEPAQGDELLKYIHDADVCLGLFGKSSKVQLVIPNKIYEAFACQKSVVTARSLAADEILKDGVHCLFCEVDDGTDLADKIMMLKNDKQLLEKIAQNGKELYEQEFNPNALGNQFKHIIENYV
ncbi:MAG: hypothetical protein COT81_04645 [Candidatus Buchananbacteria bacterium CG10_big_fil_rev_8_21_14_0_10_42_9]|uniref:Glycosyl transferase family 1 domain-containing protein n=1 Tax=Candidatus Buchananbacteria bacterium CG10_big_fil_rev_8_21_14_0_10_42_9 TaxID=1974526 RepID=A0A2H0W0H7_9BACT|nr:MAG: hypothetical protein COT81_04645 [Candidatus Buchananbacteria bacterium CG10_big_fil_rev_8_21_14_0_10_42_9]